MHPRWIDDARTFDEASDVIVSMDENPARKDNPLLPVFHEMVQQAITEMDNYLTTGYQWSMDDIQRFWAEHTLRMSYIRMSIRCVTSASGVLA